MRRDLTVSNGDVRDTLMVYYHQGCDTVHLRLREVRHCHGGWIWEDELTAVVYTRVPRRGDET